MNNALTTVLMSMGAAQLLKVPIAFMKTGRWDWNEAIEPGGMPSSHSAGVASLATYTAMKKGLSSMDFAISAVFGLIVMYDAMGIRRHAGEIAVEVNELDVKVEEIANEHPGIYHKRRHEELKEKLGHLPAEVAAGMLLGAVIGAAQVYKELKEPKLDQFGISW